MSIGIGRAQVHSDRSGGGSVPPHASTHEDGGSDEVGLDASQIVSGQFPTARIQDGAITNSKFRASAATSVVGRSAGAPPFGFVADIIAGSNGFYLQRNFGSLFFDRIRFTDLPLVFAAGRYDIFGGLAGDTVVSVFDGTWGHIHRECILSGTNELRIEGNGELWVS